MKKLTSITITGRRGKDYTASVCEAFGIEIGASVEVDPTNGWPTPADRYEWTGTGNTEFTSGRAELLHIMEDWASEQDGDRIATFQFEEGASGYIIGSYTPYDGHIYAGYLGVDDDYGATLYGLVQELELTVHIETEDVEDPARIVDGTAPMFEAKLQPKVGKFATVAEFLNPDSDMPMGIDVSAGWSTTTEGVKLLMVDTDLDVGPLRILLNDTTVYDANPDN